MLRLYDSPSPHGGTRGRGWGATTLSPLAIRERDKLGLNQKKLWYNQGMKVRDVIKQLERDGWYHVRTRGSHRQFKHPTKKGKVTISGALGEDVPIGTLRNIMRQAQGGE